MKTQMFTGLLGWDFRTQVNGDEYIFKNGYFPTPPISTAIVDFTNGIQVTIISNGNMNSVDALIQAYTKSWVKSN